VTGEEEPLRLRIRRILSLRQRRVLARSDLRPSAVLVPIYEMDAGAVIVLTKRSSALLYHKGQVSFPGGAFDKSDGDLKATALREAWEEIGISPDDVEVMGSLDDQATLSSGFAITPFVGAIPYPYRFTLSDYEVEALIEAPVSALLAPGSYCPQTADSEGVLHPWGYYAYGGHSITGITARILKQLLDLAFGRP